jgi:hypothetical protein
VASLSVYLELAELMISRAAALGRHRLITLNQSKPRRKWIIMLLPGATARSLRRSAARMSVFCRNRDY